MICQPGYHIWAWGSSGTSGTGQPPSQGTCNCGRYTYEQAHDLEQRTQIAEAKVAELERRLAEVVGVSSALYTAFMKHRTETHEVAPTFCKTCRESDAALAAWRALVAGE